MNKLIDIARIILILLGIVLFVILISFGVDYEKTQCIAEGGKWVEGVINGSYSYFCIPK